MLKLSFILPCYNVAPYVGRCIESIEHQDIPQSEYEVICVDDCSTDDTVQKIKEYQAKYPNIQLICHEVNKTAGGARNTGLNAAQGKYIWCVDPDDSIRENILGKLVFKAELIQLDILLFNLARKEKDRIEIRGDLTHRTLNSSFTGVEYIETQCAPLYIYRVVSHTCCLYRRDFLKKYFIRYPEIVAAQDVVFVWNAMLAAKKVSAINDVCYYVIRRPDSTTGRKGRFAANAILSQSILFAYEVFGLYNQFTELGPIIKTSLQKAIRYALNVDSRNVLYTSRREQEKFYNLLQQNKEKIDLLQPYMNRKTKQLFAYKKSYCIWHWQVYAYWVLDILKQRRSLLYE
jgi:glycosyltransferase involved in cell wall biosynthesis